MVTLIRREEKTMENFNKRENRSPLSLPTSRKNREIRKEKD